MANYSLSNVQAGTLQAASSSSLTTLTVTAAATGTIRRGKLYDLMFGTLGTPADNSYVFEIQRQTAAATGGTAGTPNPLDPADAAFSGLGYCNPTANGTLTSASQLFYIGINQRASYRWVASPGAELVYPATASNGLALEMSSASGTATTTAQFYFQEQ